MPRTQRTTAYLLTTIMLSVSGLSFTIEAQEAPKFDIEQLRKERPIQQVMPVKTYTEPLPGDEFVKASITKKLKPGKRVLIPGFVLHPNEVLIQRLGDRSYWLFCNNYAATVYVGDDAVLLIDLSEAIPIKVLLDAVKTITPLPITALVYTHPHVDHVGGGRHLKDAMKTKGVDLRIIGSEAIVREIKRYKGSIVPPTEILPNGRASFKFEGETFKFVTPVIWAHSGADSYVITPDGVAMVVDFFYPGALPLMGVSGVQNMKGYIDFLRHLAGEDWQHINLGHANVGYKADLMRTLEYFKDLYSALYDVWPGFAEMTASEEGVEMFKGENTGAMMRTSFDMIVNQVTDRLRKKWGHVPQWEVARDHAYEAMFDYVLHYNYSEAKRSPDIDKWDVLPNFEPIPAPK